MISLYGETIEAEHDKRLNALLDRSRQHNLKLSMDRRSELTYVGHRFSDSGLKPDPEKSEQYRKWTVQKM